MVRPGRTGEGSRMTTPIPTDALILALAALWDAKEKP